MKMKAFASLVDIILGVILGILLTVVWDKLVHPTAAEQRLTYTAYRHCMQNAGELHCHMTPDKMVEYYQIKEELGL